MLQWILFIDFWLTMFSFQHRTKDCQYGINRATDMKAYPFSSVLRRQFPKWMVCLLFFNCRSTKMPLPLFIGQIINYAFFLFFCIERYTQYIRLSPHECYSGCAVTIMALPYMDYTALIKVIEASKIEDDIIGSTGLLLKKYPKAFTEYLSRTQTRRSTKIKKIISGFIAVNSSYVSEMKPLLEVCKSK